MGRIAGSVHPGALVAIDTAIFIYYLEADSRRANLVQEFFDDVATGRIRGIASVVALIEILVLPLRLRQSGVARDYREFFLGYPNLALREVTVPIAQRAADVRADYRVPIADSIHLATAVESGADLFLTNDRRLARFPLLPVAIVDDFLE